MELIIDTREKQRIDIAEKWAKQNKIEYEMKQLPNSDYIFVKDDITVGFEFKHIQDFIQSVKDGRIFRQIQEMDNTFNFILVSGFKDAENYLYRVNALTNRKIYRTDLIGAICRLNTLSNGVIVQWHYNIPDDLLFMRKQAEKCFTVGNANYGVFTDKKKSDNAAVNYLSSIKGVSYKKANDICEKYNCNNLVDLLGLTTSALCKVDGIGQATANKIIMSLGS